MAAERERRLQAVESIRAELAHDVEVPDDEAFNRALQRSDGYLTGARALLTELQSYLDNKWKAR